MFAAVYALAFALLVIVVASAWPASYDYRFSLPDGWMDSCLGGDPEFDDLLDSDAIEPRGAPSVSEIGTISTYRCSWSWNIDDGGPAQTLTLQITIDADDERGGYAALGEEGPQPYWELFEEELEGFDEGYCQGMRDFQSERFECVGAVDNLEVSIDALSPGQTAVLFGPGNIDVRDLIVRVGEFAREHLRAE